MYSKGPDNSYRRQDGDRNSRRSFGDHDDRREERRDFHSNAPRDPYHKYIRDGRRSTDRVSKSRDYSDSPKRLCRSDLESRDWNRKSPVRRRLSPPDWDVPEVKRQRHTEEDDSDYRHKQNFLEKTYRLSPSSFSRNQQLEYSPSHKDDIRYRKSSPYSRSRLQREELPLRRQSEDFCDRDPASSLEGGTYQKRRLGYSPERTYLPDDTTKIKATMTERIPNASTSGYYNEYYESRTTAPLNKSSDQSLKSDAHPQCAAPSEDKSSKGFQRFLEVLNKGVNVDVLTQIVSQNPTLLCEGRVFPKSFANVADQQWSSGCTQTQQKHYEDESYLNKSKGPLRSPSPRPHRWSASPNRNPASVRESYYGSKSPSVEKINLTREDEQKRKQMQDVLKAIGVDLGFEELGQMSHRIQERLYGRRENERGHKLSREKSAGQTLAAGQRSRSSSSSSVSPPQQSFYRIKDSVGDPRHDADQQQLGKTSEMNRKPFQDVQKSEGSKINTVNSTPARNIMSFNPIPAVNRLLSAAVPPGPTYSPIRHPPAPYPTFPPPPLPFFPNVGPGIFIPRPPFMLPQQGLRLPNVFSPLFPQMRPSLPPQLQLLNPPIVNEQMAKNAVQKSKTQERHRFLQVIK